MKFKKSLGLLTLATITTAPVAAVISCGAEAAPLSMADAITVPAATDGSNPFVLNELPFSDGKQLFNEAQMEQFQKNLGKHLYYGPEAWDLKSITLDPGHITSGSQLGVYYPASKQIFINIADLEGAIGKYTIDEVYEVIEKVIAHEYGHHYFATYANGYTRNDPAVKNEDGYVYDTAGNQRYISAWNEKYFNEFTSDYNLLDDKATLATAKYGQEDNIDSIFTLKNLFDNANRKGSQYKLDWKGHSKVEFASSVNTITGTPASYLVSVDKDNAGSLRYIYSMDEQVTRKMQMMFYPSQIDGGRFTFDSSLLKISAHKSSFFDPYAVDWMRSNDLYRDGSGSVHKAAIYPDDIFASNKVDKEYGELLDLMGYGDEISHMYSANGAKVSGPNSIVGLTSSNNNKVRISGYLPTGSNYDQIVDEKGVLIVKFDTNQKTKFQFNHKATWNASDASEGPTGTVYKTYITKQFNIADFKGKQLFFGSSTDTSVHKEITKINQDGDDTNINSYDSQRPGGTYYKISETGSKVTIGRYI